MDATEMEVMKEKVYLSAYAYYVDRLVHPKIKNQVLYYTYIGICELAGTLLRGGGRVTYPDMADGWLGRIDQKAQDDARMNHCP